MNDWEFYFEDMAEDPVLLEGLQPGQTYSAVQVLAELEAHDEETLKAVLDAMTENRITLDVSQSPRLG